jgi:hypothetical protein
MAKLRARIIPIHEFAREHPLAMDSALVDEMTNPRGVVVTYGKTVIRNDIIDEYVDEHGFGGPTAEDVGDRYLALNILGPLLALIPTTGESNA